MSIMSADSHVTTVEPRFNEPLFNEVLVITNDILCPGQSYSKMYGIEPRYNEPRYNEFFDITNIIRKPKRKIYLDITNYNVKTRQKINAEQINSQQVNGLLYVTDIGTIEIVDRSHLCYKSIINYDLDITNIVVIFPQIRYIEVFDITNPPFNEQIWPVPGDFVKSRFHCSEIFSNKLVHNKIEKKTKLRRNLHNESCAILLV